MPALEQREEPRGEETANIPRVPCVVSFHVFESKKSNKSSLYSPYYFEAWNELRGSYGLRLGAWATQLRRRSQRWRADLTDTEIEPQTLRTDNVARNNCVDLPVILSYLNESWWMCIMTNAVASNSFGIQNYFQ